MWRKYKGMGFQLTVHLMLLRIETYPWANMKSRAVVRWHSVQDKIVPIVSAPVSMCLEQAWVHHFAFNLDKMWYILTMVKMMMKGLKTKHYGELLKELQGWGRLREVPQLKDRIRTNKWRLQMVVLTIWIKKPTQLELNKSETGCVFPWLPRYPFFLALSLCLKWRYSKWCPPWPKSLHSTESLMLLPSQRKSCYM